MSKNPTTIPRRQLGRQLRELRQAVGLSLADAARLIERGAGTLQRLEKGENPRIRQLDIEALCKLYSVSEERTQQMKALTLQADRRTRPADESHWWARYEDLIPAEFETYMSLEMAADRMITYQPDTVPGIVQTADYARALNRVFFTLDTAMELEQRVQVRMQRQTAITRRLSPLEVDLLIDEAAVRRVAGSRKIMAAQLRLLADAPPNVRVRVIPFSGGFPLGGHVGPFVILDFPTDPGTYEPVEPSTVYVESYGSRMYYDSDIDVSRYRDAYTKLGWIALNDAETKNLLRCAATECEA
ncbi:helix-turn-helix domain-containing protein [Nocardia sp. NPDC004711]